MIIDAHSHMGRSWFAWWDNKVTHQGFVESMDRWGIDKSCVSYWGIFYDPHAGNDEIKEFMNEYPDRIIGFACVNPRFYDDAVNEVIRAKELGFKGLKLHPAATEWYADSPLVYPVVEKAIELDLPMLFHSGKDEYSHPRNLGNLAKRYPEATFIMGHIGEEAVLEGVQVGAQYENILLDTTGSYNLYDIMKYVLHYVGDDRVVFGLDFPAYNPGPEISKVKDANIPDKSKEKIMGLNMKRLLKL